MYSDQRPFGNTPEVWEASFGRRAAVQDRLALRRLGRDPRWRELAARLPAGARVLDAGSGTGFWVAFLADRGYVPTGMDFSEELVRGASKHYPGHAFRHGAIQAMPFADGEFDAVVSWGVIEHDEAGPRAALAEFARVLRPGGLLLVTVPLDTPAMRAASTTQFGEHGEFFQYFFTPVELAGAVRDAGFDVERVSVSSRHYAPVFPRLHARAAAVSPLLRDALSQLLRPVVGRHPNGPCMLLAVARRRDEARYIARPSAAASAP